MNNFILLLTVSVALHIAFIILLFYFVGTSQRLRDTISFLYFRREPVCEMKYESLAV